MGNDSGQPEAPRRLWTPWRMNYISGGAKESGCIFCNRVHSDDDVASLILHRANHAFVIMNLFPYNTGHVMIVPNAHADSPESLDPASLVEMTSVLPIVLRATRRVLSCQGFNIGMNVGAIAGAGVAEHLHEHVVPRWQGDANFMPILGSAMVIPELIPVTYVKLRAEIHREASATTAANYLVISDDRNRIAASDGKVTHSFALTSDRPVWRAALDDYGSPAAIVGWAGQNRTDGDGGITLALSATPDTNSRLTWHPLDNLPDSITPAERDAVTQMLTQLAPIAD
jgi:ATP adenylyltransferase